VEIGRFDFLPEELDERRQSASNTPVNINTAGLEDLMRLKRVGKVLAQRIIDYRSSKGRFRSKEDIKNVKGIGDGLFEEIKKSISVE
jgi:competence protein ComEA